MIGYAYRKLRYVVWDTTNLDELAEFLPGAFIGDNGNVFLPYFGDAQVTTAIGNVVVELGNGPGFEFYETEAAFRDAYDIIPEA
ncbi:hypothetical protein AB0383_48730 [Amycolatopsis sp. NPDC051373]|uniref:hypothetical protein n=1 Tax=Amycolatopsis sp. NPDC051373 TaxID=3155801 RepID=UPI00344E597F